MNIQFVCLVNSFQEGGRCLAGILLKDGKIIVQNGRPKWVRLITKGSRNGILTGFVVDLLPMDILEVEVFDAPQADHPFGAILCDPYSIKIKGKMDLAVFWAQCNAACAVEGHSDDLAEDGGGADFVGEAMWIVNTQDCRVIENEVQGRMKPSLSLAFACDAGSFQLPIVDPWFLAAYYCDSELLMKSQSPILVLTLKGKSGKRKTKNVATVLI